MKCWKIVEVDVDIKMEVLAEDNLLYLLDEHETDQTLLTISWNVFEIMTSHLFIQIKK